MAMTTNNSTSVKPHGSPPGRRRFRIGEEAQAGLSLFRMSLAFILVAPLRWPIEYAHDAEPVLTPNDLDRYYSLRFVKEQVS
jgi:hypothetical protein